MSVGFQLAVPAAVLAIACAGLVRAAETAAPAVSERDLQAKIQYCTSCHQPSGQGFRGSSPIPRLAGQQPEYFENQLKAFIERRRTNKFMFKVAHSLSPEMLSALAAHFNELNPKPLGGAPKDRFQPERRSLKREFPTPIFLPAPVATVRRPRVMGPFLASQANSILTS